MPRFLLLAALAAPCSLNRDAAPSITIVNVSPPPTAAATAAELVTASDGKVYGVVRLLWSDGECSGAGGEHDVLEIDAPGLPQRRVHAGGHAVYLELERDPDGPGWSDPCAERYFVAQISMFAAPAAPFSNLGWCVDLPTFDGEATSLLRAHDRGDARRLLSEIGAGGPRSSALAGARWLGRAP